MIIEDTIKQDPELQFDNPEIFTYFKKLETLEYHSEKLFKADREQLMNRIGMKTICRMQESIQQSYFMLDSEEYEEARKLHYVPYRDLKNHLGIVDDEAIESSSSQESRTDNE